MELEATVITETELDEDALLGPTAHWAHTRLGGDGKHGICGARLRGTIAPPDAAKCADCIEVMHHGGSCPICGAVAS